MSAAAPLPAVSQISTGSQNIEILPRLPDIARTASLDLWRRTADQQERDEELKSRFVNLGLIASSSQWANRTLPEAVTNGLPRLATGCVDFCRALGRSFSGFQMSRSLRAVLAD